ncbi:MAG: MG2 domain-containing protein, partial [Prolixibacteraceae bacterium]
MKNLLLLLLIVCTGLTLSAQDQGPIPKISKQMADYFTAFPKEKVFVATDKNIYKPGETVWFRAFVTDWNHQPAVGENGELFVKLYDLKGKSEVQELY